MANSIYYPRILEELEQIPEHQLGPLAEFIRYYRLGLEREAAERKSRGFSEISGVISDEVADAMLAAIEEDCERIEPDGW